ncbi:hypothetical protein HMN09_01297300 [Mycena chlorophos]|uniref:Uncharacterized protein n=1 Tax=Mycena chlorophos TaxID=658473 RepID=A0A8H6S147_MYCCL|nr:hypothetical protein HMN09_01297300 [Mycena chlorophos]
MSSPSDSKPASGRATLLSPSKLTKASLKHILASPTKRRANAPSPLNLKPVRRTSIGKAKPVSKSTPSPVSPVFRGLLFTPKALPPSPKSPLQRQAPSPTESESLFTRPVGSALSEDNESPTEARFLDRPASSPEVSTQTLPPLCTEDDSDDEAFVENGEFEEYDEEDYELDEEKQQDGYSYVGPSEAGVDPEYSDEYPSEEADDEWRNNRLNDYLAQTATETVYEEPVAFAFTFTFIAPFGAPLYPTCDLVYAPMRLVPVATGAIVHGGHVHERPSDEYLFDPKFVDYRYDSFGPYDLHRAILDRSVGRDPRSYAQAPPATQALVRQLALEYPQIRPDMLTPVLHEVAPTSLGNHPYACPFPSCDEHIQPTLHAAEEHIAEAHGQLRTCPVPDCSEHTKPVVPDLATHVHCDHRVEPARAKASLECKMCGDRYVGGKLYAVHASRCARGRSPEAAERPAKRVRIA